MKISEELRRRVVIRIQSIMDMLNSESGGRLRWFYAFGTFLEFMASRTFSLNYDIDIAVFYEEPVEGQLRGGFATYGYRLDGAIRNDVTGKPFNLHFKPDHETLAGTPTVDIFFLYPYGSRRIYTYDVEREGKEIPSNYLFKVCPRRWLEPTDGDIQFALRGCSPEQRRILNEKTGIWRYHLYEPDSQYEFPVPFNYGSILDLMYPGWWYRQNYKGQSKSLEVIKVKSCKELHKRGS